MNKVMWGQ